MTDTVPAADPAAAAPSAADPVIAAAKTTTPASAETGENNAEDAPTESAQAKPADAASDPKNHKKCFVGGLNHQTDEVAVKAYFSKYGQVVDAIVMRDSYTRISRGFGFVTFATEAAYDQCLSDGPHMIDGHKVEPKAAVKRTETAASARIPKRMFAGGLPQGITDDEFRAYFAQYGEIEAAEIMYDRETKRMRGFGFITFKEEEGAKKCMAIRNHEINGKFVELKGAETREQRVANSYPRGPPGMRDGRYGGPGGHPQAGGHGYPPRGGPPSLTGQRGGYDQGYNSYGGNQAGYNGGYNGGPGGYNQGAAYNQSGNQGGYQRNDRPAPLGGGRQGYDRQAGYGGYDQGQQQGGQQDAYGGYGGYGGGQQPPQQQAGYDQRGGAGGYGGYDAPAAGAAGGYDPNGYGGQPHAAGGDHSNYGDYGGQQYGSSQAQGGYGGARNGAPRMAPQQRNYNPY